jgi:N-acetylglutamate synthase-like GNAT family acetyltransferase
MHTMRPATRKDSTAIHLLIYKTGINPMDLDWRRFLVIVDEHNRLLACGQVKPHPDGTRELASLAVQPDYRRQGLARQVIEHLQGQYHPPLYLICRDTLQPLYEKFGFRVVSLEELPPYFKHLTRRVSMLRRLSPVPFGLRVMLWNPS